MSEAHDAGEKTLFGRKACWSGSDLIKALIEMPATATAACPQALRAFFRRAGTGRPRDSRLAEGLRQHRLDVAWGCATILRSSAFFADANIGTRVKSPVEHVLGATIALGCAAQPPSTLVLADWMARLGEDLFYPPNVGGWPAGRSWLSSRWLVGRVNFAADLVEGSPVGMPGPLEPLVLARQQGKPSDCAGVIDAVGTLLLGSEPGSAWRDAIAQACEAAPRGKQLSRAAALVLATPKAQLG